MRTLRGVGPAPAGYVTCRKADCPARRNPATGRLERVPSHYHPQPETLPDTWAPHGMGR